MRRGYAPLQVFDRVGDPPVEVLIQTDLASSEPFESTRSRRSPRFRGATNVRRTVGRSRGGRAVERPCTSDVPGAAADSVYAHGFILPRAGAARRPSERTFISVVGRSPHGLREISRWP